MALNRMGKDAPGKPLHVSSKSYLWSAACEGNRFADSSSIAPEMCLSVIIQG